MNIIILHPFYQQKEFPTLDKILKIVREDLNFPGDGTSTNWNCEVAFNEYECLACLVKPFRRQLPSQSHQQIIYPANLKYNDLHLQV